jgi:3-dehydroquinate synthetase
VRVGAIGRPVSMLTMRFGIEEISYAVGYDCESALFETVSDAVGGNDVLLLADVAVKELASRVIDGIGGGTGRTMRALFLSLSESTKSFSTVQGLVESALDSGLSRRTSVIALGGGVVGNLAGMVAGLLFRGVPLIHLPTTPVAAFDAVISRKQAVNVGVLKNAAGLFKSPALIALDLKWLESVPRELMRTGLLEMAKNVLAVRPDYRGAFTEAVGKLDADPETALFTLHEIGFNSKVPFLAVDANETADALVFEYGHTIGHAIEGASRGLIHHGEAVGWGMLAAADISLAEAGLSAAEHQAHDEILGLLGIMRHQPPRVDPAAVKQLVRADTKRGYTALDEDRTPMVLLAALGQPSIDLGKPLCQVKLSTIDSAIDDLLWER